MNLQQNFLQHFKQNISTKLPANALLIVAVSGGVDSVVLTELLQRLNIKFSIAHCNFNLRGEESVRDEDFVKTLASSHNIPCFIKHFNTAEFIADNKLSAQVAARKLRYNWFEELQEQNTQPTYILTAHHANDNVETAVNNFFRGTGIAGLIGIKVFDIDRRIIRPLLPFTKQEIIEFAQQNNIAFVEDSSNQSNKYTRNSFRNEVLPLVEKIYPEAQQNILNNIHRLQNMFELYQQQISNIKKELIEVRNTQPHISIIKLKKNTAAETILWEIIKDYGFAAQQTSEVFKLLSSKSGSYVASASHTVLNNRNHLVIYKNNVQDVTSTIIGNFDNTIRFINGELSFKTLQLLPQNLQKTPATTAIINAAEIKFPLLVRKWQQGDYFYPLGLKKKQKLSRFFINQKLSLQQKQHVCVLESNKKIVWVIGYRIDDRFKVDAHTKNMVQISFNVSLP